MNYEEFKKLFEARAAMINGNAESQVRASRQRIPTNMQLTHWSHVFCIQVLRDAFKVFDKDGSGKLSREELRSFS